MLELKQENIKWPYDESSIKSKHHHKGCLKTRSDVSGYFQALLAILNPICYELLRNKSKFLNAKPISAFWKTVNSNKTTKPEIKGR